MRKADATRARRNATRIRKKQATAVAKKKADKDYLHSYAYRKAKEDEAKEQDRKLRAFREHSSVLGAGGMATLAGMLNKRSDVPRQTVDYAAVELRETASLFGVSHRNMFILHGDVPLIVDTSIKS